MLPFGVVYLLEARPPCDADVVDEHVETTESAHRLPDRTLGLAGHGKIGRDMVRLADSRCSTASAGDDAGTLGDQQPSGLEADTGGGAGDQARTS